MSKIRFVERQFPSANTIAIGTARPIVIDTGFGSDEHLLEALLRQVDVAPQNIHLIISTHHHTDHTGGNHYLQERYDTSIAMHKWEAGLINRNDPDAFLSEYLDQPVESFRVTRNLSHGDEVSSDDETLRVIHTPGHTLGHIALYSEAEKTLICGDLFYEGDVGWLNMFREGAGALERALDSIEAISALPVERCLPGHGPEVDFKTSLQAAHRRYSGWLHDPKKIAWHGCKRIFAFALMIRGGIENRRVKQYLVSRGWLRDFSKYIFNADCGSIADELVNELLRTGAAAWANDRLIINTPHLRPSEAWIEQFFADRDEF